MGELFCLICSGVIIWIVLRLIFFVSKPEKEVETKIVRVFVEPPPLPPIPAPAPVQPAPEAKPEAPRPAKCPSCGASLGRKSVCDYCGDGQ